MGRSSPSPLVGAALSPLAGALKRKPSGLLVSGGDESFVVDEFSLDSVGEDRHGQSLKRSGVSSGDLPRIQKLGIPRKSREPGGLPLCG